MIARKVVCRMTKREARAWAKARRAELDMAAVGRGMAQALFSLPQWQRAGAVLAFALLRPFLNGLLLGVLFGAVAGIMVYIAVEELIPSSRQYGHDRPALWATLCGICVMPLTHLFQT